jgi:signal transduction histidine kinase/sensor domain CHASE-containing protein
VSLAQKTVLIIGAAMLLSIGTLYGVSRLILLNSYSDLEVDVAEQNMERVFEAIGAVLSRLDSIAGDWAPWDETYAFVAGEYPEYSEGNLTDETIANLNANFMLFFESSGRYVFGKAVDLVEFGEAPVPASFLEHVSRNPFVLEHPNLESAIGGIVLLDDGPVMIASQPILTSLFKGPIRGTLVVGKYLDSLEIDQLSRLTQLSIEVFALNQSALPGDLQIARESLSADSPILARVESKRTLAGYALLDDVYGQPAVMVRVALPRDIYAQGLTSFRYFMVWLVLLGAAASLAMFLLLRSQVVSRLTRLDSTLRYVRKSGDLSARVALKGKDELSDFAEGVNEMLEALQQTEAALKQSGKRYIELFENSPVGLWEQDFKAVRKYLLELRQAGIADLEQHFTANPADLMKCANLIKVTDVNLATVTMFRGKTKDALMESINDVFVEESLPVFLKSLLSIDAGAESFSSDQILQTLDGERLAVAFAWTEMQDRVLTVTLDITERKQAQKDRINLEAQLRQAQRLESIGTLASGVAHEVNNPLTGIINYAELVKDLSQGDERALEYTQGIIVEGNRIATIVKNLLSFSRQNEETSSPARIADIVDASMSLLQASLRREQIEVVLDIPENLPMVHCRSQQIQQVLVNLITNSLAALNERFRGYDVNKLLSITADTLYDDDNTWLRITVEDHGKGIPEDIRGQVFDPFFTSKTRDQGTGLGLSVSHGIVMDHHGRMSFETQEDLFTRFFVDLPLHSDS